MESDSIIDTDRFSSQLRAKGVDVQGERVLITQFADSSQQQDLTLPANCAGFGRIHHFRRTSGNQFPDNPLPAAPAEHYFGRYLGDTVKVQVFQNAICSWRCWYCFVDYKLLSGNLKHAAFKTADELIDLYLAEPYQCPIIDLSGGQPDLAPEWIFWFAEALKRRGLDQRIYLWSDDNLSNDYLWRYLRPNQLCQLASMANYSRVGCFKGFNERSFSFNTKAASSLFDRQFDTMKRLIETGLDMFGYITLTTPKSTDIARDMSRFFDKLQEKVHPLFPLRTIPLQIHAFTPTRKRMDDECEKAIELQSEAIEAWNEQIMARFSRSDRIKRITEIQLL